MRQRTSRPEKTDARKKFQKYKKEETVVTRPMQVTEPSVIKLLEAWRDFDFHDDGGWIDANLAAGYEKALEAVKDLRYSAEDVEIFSRMLADIRTPNTDAGLFLTALVNSGPDSGYTVHAHGEAEMGIGHQNTKDLTIIGECSFVCNAMKSGRVTIRGNVPEPGIGDGMEDGVICIKGDLGSGPFQMRGGTVIIEGKPIHSMIDGKPVYDIADRMEGGEIHIEGDIEHYDILIEYLNNVVEHGKIFHKGKLIVDK